MKCIITYFNCAFKALKESSGENKKTFAFVSDLHYFYVILSAEKLTTSNIIIKLIKQFNYA